MRNDDHAPTPAQIRVNLAFSKCLDAKGRPKNEGLITGQNATDPKLIDPQQLAADEVALKRAISKQGQEADQQLLTRLRDHAAAYIMKHFPKATYPRQDHPDIPTNAAIAHIAHNWPAVTTARTLQPQPIHVPRRHPSNHVSNIAKQEPVSAAQNTANWTARRQAAREYLEEFQDTGQPPPFPMVRDPDDDQQLIRREGWQDFWDHRHNPKAMPPPDTSKPAIPGRWLPGQSPDDAIMDRKYQDIVKKLQRPSAAQPPELLQAHATRIYRDTYDPVPQSTTQSRHDVEEAIGNATRRVHSAFINVRHEEQCHTQAAQAAQNLCRLLRHIANTYFTDDAEIIADIIQPLPGALDILIKDRNARQTIGVSPKSLAAEARNLEAVKKAITRIKGTAKNPPHHPDDAVHQAWQYAADSADLMMTHLSEYQPPDHEAPYEIEDLQAISRTPIQELENRAVTRYAQHTIECDETLLIVPDQWVVSLTRRVTKPHDDPATSFEHISQRFPDQTFPQVLQTIQRLRDETAQEIRGLPELIDQSPDPSEDEGAFWDWSRQTAQVMVTALHDAETDAIPTDAKESLRSILISTQANNIREVTTARMRQELSLNVRLAYQHCAASRWNKAIAHLATAREITDPVSTGLRNTAAYVRTQSLRGTTEQINSMTEALRSLAKAERQRALARGTAWMLPETGKPKAPALF